MKHEFENSSSLKSAEYNDTVTFTSGKSYRYADVPKEIYDALISAGSAGRFYQSQIKGTFKLVE